MTQPTDVADFRFATVAIVGVGLIGGSIAAAVRQRSVCRTILGVGRDTKRLAEAQRRGLIDDLAVDLELAAARADLLVFCTPVDRIVAGVHAAALAAQPGTLITDAGSVKGAICDGLAGRVPAGIEFVGSHPLAGSEKQGFEHADAMLFERRVCVVTPVATNSPDAIRRIAGFWEAIGSRVLEMTPQAHDEVLARTSHVPHVVAAALAATLSDDDRPLAATGFRDTTRIAAGDAELWSAILLANAGPVLAGLKTYEAALADLRQAIEREDASRLRKLLASAKTARDALNRHACR